MNLTMRAHLKEQPKYIIREFKVNDTMRLDTFCEYVIISMNGLAKNPYAFSFAGRDYLCRGMCEEEDLTIEDQTLGDLSFTCGSKAELMYGEDGEWEIDIEVIELNEECASNDFEVIYAKGKGIIENNYMLFRYCNLYKNPFPEELMHGPLREYLETYDKVYTSDDWNEVIKDYQRQKEEKYRPKNYRLNVSLVGFRKEIKRKFMVNSNIPLDTFCRSVIKSMRGNLYHSWGIRIRGEYIKDFLLNSGTLGDLELKDKQKFFVIYDFGDDWEFEVNVSKIYDDFNEKTIELIDGKGYGIIEDCGGAWCLLDEMKDDGKIIEDFDLEEFRKIVDEYA